MAGVSLDTAPTAAPNRELELDFRAIYEGGQGFTDRVKMLSDLRTQYEMAYANLLLGDNAKAALDDAQKKQADASSRLEEANKALVAAEKTAEDIIQAAKDQAKEILDNANGSAATSMSLATQMRTDADEYSKSAKANADAALSRAQETEAAAARTQQAAVAALKDQQDAKTSHLQAKSASEAEKAKYLKLQDKIAAFAKELTQ